MAKKIKLIDEERKLMGLSIEKMAELLGVSARTIYGWKKDLFKPSARTAKRMLDAGFSKEVCLNPSQYSKGK